MRARRGVQENGAGYTARAAPDVPIGGLVWGQELYFDATKINANADLDSLTPRFALEAREALHAHLAAVFAAGDPSAEDSEQAEQELPGPAPEAAEGPPPADPSPSLISLPVSLPAPQQAELAAANAVRHDWIAEEGRPQREVRGSGG